MTDCCLVYVTTSSQQEAQNLARTVVTERLAACANVLGGGIESYYHWEGKFEVGSEHLLLLKTTHSKLESLTQRLRELHSYSCPAIVALPILDGHPPFLDWIRSEVGHRGLSA